MKFDFNNNLYVAQVVPTIQGEGKTAGVPSLLIRFYGCNCRCTWCDTKWSWKYDEEDSQSQIINNSNFHNWMENIIDICYNKYKISNLMITGGEPLLYANNPLFKTLVGHSCFKTVEIETNGSLLTPKLPLVNNRNILFNISPKLHREWYVDSSEFAQLLDNMKHMMGWRKYQFKFVDDPKDRELIDEFVQEVHIPHDTISLMPLTPKKPEGISGEDYWEWLENYTNNKCFPTLRCCMEKGYRFSPRMHLFMFQDRNETF